MEELLDQQHKLLMRGSLLHAKIGARKIPKLPEPPKTFAAWDYVLEEMKWMAHDFMEERRHKSVLALVLVTEIRENQRNKVLRAQEILKHSQTQAKFLSDAVQNCYMFLEDLTKEEEEDAPIDQGPMVAGFMVRVIRHLSYSAANPDPPNKDEMVAPANADENALDPGSTCDEAPMVSVQNLLFYDVEDLGKCEAEWKAFCELQNLEDVDLYAPPVPDSVLVDVSLEMWEKERKSYDLLPDAEELTLMKNSLPQEELSDLPRLMRFQSELHEFSNSPKLLRRWQIFQDMYLEKYVSEHGGHWDLVADLMNVNPFTKGGCFSMKECRDRWISLQKQKGRPVDPSYTPQAVMQQDSQLVTEYRARYSQYPLKLDEEEKVREVARPKVPDKEPMVTEEPFQFLITNCSFEVNPYFYHYAELNSRFYPEESISRFSFISKPGPPPLRVLLSHPETTPVAKCTTYKEPFEIPKPVAQPRHGPVPMIPVIPKSGPPKPQGRQPHLGVSSPSMTPTTQNTGRGAANSASKRRADDTDGTQR